jgi:hypothetical protein
MLEGNSISVLQKACTHPNGIRRNLLQGWFIASAKASPFYHKKCMRIETCFSILKGIHGEFRGKPGALAL